MIEIRKFRTRYGFVYAKKPVFFDVRHEGDCFHIDHPVLGVNISAESFDGVDDLLREELDFLWETYAMESNDKLSKIAEVLKRSLLDAFVLEPKKC